MDLMHKVVSETDFVALLGANIGVGIAPESSAQSGLVSSCCSSKASILHADVSVYAVAGRQRSTAANTLIKMLRAADWTEQEAAAKASQPSNGNGG